MLYVETKHFLKVTTKLVFQSLILVWTTFHQNVFNRKRTGAKLTQWWIFRCDKVSMCEARVSDGKPSYENFIFSF